MLGRIGGALAVVLLNSFVAYGQPGAQDTRIPAGASVFIGNMSGFEQDLTVAIIGARIPVVLVKDRHAADFEITGRSVKRQSDSPLRESVEEATLAVADAKTGAVVDAFTVTKADTKSLASACASRFDEKVGAARNLIEPTVPPQPAVPPVPESPFVRLFIQGDFRHLSDFAQVFRSELRRLGITIDVVERGTAHDYNIVTAQDSSSAAALALDANGLIIVSAVSTGWSEGGAVGNSARDLAKRLAAAIRGAR